MKKEFLYQRIAGILEQQITRQVLAVGDKLPSIRTLQGIYQVSLNTAKQVYLELERRGLVEARPKSGYFISRLGRRALLIPSTSAPGAHEARQQPEELLRRTFATLGDSTITQLSLSVPDAALLPVAKLTKSLATAVRALPDSGIGYDSIPGNLHLRRTVARWSFVWGGGLTEEDVVTTSGTLNAIDLCLQATTRPGDTIAVESPVYFNLLHAARAHGLRVLELPTHPVTGLEVEALKRVLPQIQACALIPTFSNPLGSCMPDEHKRAVVRLLAQHGIPLIEDDIYGDMFFGERRPAPCKAYDEEGLVLWCSSVSKSLAPGYRVGWVAPGRYKEQVLRLKLLQTVSTPPLLQEVVADFMDNGRYEHHLRGFRRALHHNSRQYQQAIEAYFPEDTRVSQPQGGFMLWAELNPKINTVDLFDTALRHLISIAPGRLFTLQDQYYNCLRLNYGLQWSPQLDARLQQLGTLLKNAL